MNRLYTLGIAALAIVVLAGCKDIKEFTESPECPEQTIVLTATHEELYPDSKTLRMDDGSTWWNPAEEISVFYGTGTAGGSKFVSNNTAQAKTVEFEGSVSISGNEEFWAVYPYSTENSCDGTSIITVIPSEQVGVAGNFSGDAFPVMGKSGSLTMPFYNICGGLKFSVSRSDIKSITIKGNNGEFLAGKVKVIFGMDGKPEIAEVVDGKAEITLTASDDGSFKEGKYYYMTLLPTALVGGFTMTFTTAAEEGKLTASSAQTIKRSIFGVLKTVDSKVKVWESIVPEHEYVDLGLSVKWATFNIGATNPEEYGDYFAWGETEPKEDYSWSTYKWRDGSDDSLTKYNTYNSYGTVDYKTVLDPEDDAAHENWGAPWRMPTLSEITELIDNCSWEWTTLNGVYGRKVTSKKAGYTDKCIFLPAGSVRSGTSLGNFGSFGDYWSSTLVTFLSDPHDFGFNSDYVFGSNPKSLVEINHNSRVYGHSVRPVYGEFIPVTSISLNETALGLDVGDTYGLEATVSPTNATAPGVSWVSGDESIVTVNHEGILIALREGTTTISVYASNGLSASCRISVKTEPESSPEAVDLGLSVKWATFNVGANKPEQYGDYFAWGETEPKEDYSWSTYKWRDGSDDSLTKYNTDSSYGTVDGKTVLDMEDDAARANWGEPWRMPTLSEVFELIYDCSWEWTTLNGVYGRKVTSKKAGYTDKYIFLPASSIRIGDDPLVYGGHDGYYWSSSASSNLSCSLTFDSRDEQWYIHNRYVGQSIRPVSE